MKGPATLSQGLALARQLSAERQEDPSLPLLLDLLDIESLRAFWASRPELVKAAAPAELVEVEVLRYRPGRRCALQVRRAAGASSFFVKLFHGGCDGRARRVGKVLRRLERQGPWEELCLPRLLDCVEEQGMVVLSEVPGRSWEELLTEGGASAEGARLAGLGLARFHSLSPARLRPWTAEKELEAVQRHLEAWHEDGHPLARRFSSGVLKLSEFLPRLHDRSFGPLHRDLHPQQVLMSEAGVGFVDLDDAAAGPAEVDVGNLLAHLDLSGFLQDELQPALKEQELAFLSGHATAGGQVDPSLLAVARAATLLRLAGIHGLRTDGGALVVNLLDAADAHLRRGLGS
jgi:hypothetical protein